MWGSAVEEVHLMEAFTYKAKRDDYIAAGQEMQTKAARFLEFQRSYYLGEGEDKELARMVTQPYWQSMRLSKRRLKTIQVHAELVDDYGE